MAKYPGMYDEFSDEEAERGDPYASQEGKDVSAAAEVGLNYFKLPEEYNTLRKCLKAVCDNWENIWNVPDPFITVEMCSIAMRFSGNEATVNTPESMRELS